MSAHHAPARRPLALAASLVGAALLATAAGLAAPAAAQTYSWNTGNGSWGNGVNWAPFGPPADHSTIRIGNLAGVQNSTVMMGGGVSAVVFDHLEITDGMTVDMNGSELQSFQEAWITGANSRVISRPSPYIHEHDFRAQLRLGAGAYFELRDDSYVGFYAGWSEGTILGRGHIQVVDLFRNDGVIDPDNNGGILLESGASPLLQTINLDGNSGNGHLLLNTPFSVLEVWASALTDPFSGTVTMVPGALLTMDIDEGWTMDGPALISVAGNNNPAAASQIAGSPLTFRGTIGVGGAQGHLRVLTETDIESPASILVGEGDHLEFDGATTVWGGDFEVLQGGALDFDAPTTMRGGSFVTPSTAVADGSVDFNGSTTWNGGAAVAGLARQMGNAFVLGPTVIDATVFDMDGAGGTAWTVWNDLVVNADSLQPDDTDTFAGTVTVANGTLGRLTVHVEPLLARFEMAGEMNLIGHPSVFSTRYDGSTLDLLGELNVSGLVATGGYLRAFDGAINIGAPGAVLRLDAGGLITAGCTFGGDGELWIGPTSSPLFVETDFNGVGLVNQGTLRVAYTATADRFRGEPGSSWLVSMRGHEPGVTYDQLVVTGGDATLAGTIEVELQNVIPGGTLFSPVVGDEFTILTATGGVSGTFANDPVTVVGAVTYEWSVRYEPNAVVLRLDSIGPCYPDCTGDGVLTVADFGCFQTKFVGGSPYADCNSDGLLTVADFGCFQTKFVQGCP